MGPFETVLLIVACHHIAIIQTVCGHVLRRYSKSFTSQTNGAKNKLYVVTHIHLTGCVQTASYKKWIHVVFSQWVDQSEHEAGKTSNVVLRMSEMSLNILRAKYLNG